MIDVRQFYSRLLELTSPWTVKDVVFQKERVERIEVHLECEEEAQLPCARCGRSCPVADYEPARIWHHLDTSGKATCLHARPPVVQCFEHGRQHPGLPWGRRDSPATHPFEILVAQTAKALDDTKKTALFLRVSHSEVRQILLTAAQEAVGAHTRDTPSTDDHPASKQALSKPQVRQLSLFEQNEMTFVNRGIQAYRSLELEKAIELFQKHRSLFPKGLSVDARVAAAETLLRFIREAPAEPSARLAHLCHVWSYFESYLKSKHPGDEALGAEVRPAFFARVLLEAKQCGLSDFRFLHGGIPLGYVLLQAGRLEEAIQSLQSSVPEAPQSAALYGYLGDAYRVRGDLKVARQCYREACLIDPAGIDWSHLQDEELRELKDELWLVYGFDDDLAVAWLPSHARINGLFERKELRLHEGSKEMVHDYLALEKGLAKQSSPKLAAGLFFRGMVLCENQESLKLVKKIDLIHVRRMMKQANPDLFADFLEKIVEGKSSE